MGKGKSLRPLILKHSVKGRLLRTYSLRGGSRILGSSRTADIRIVSSDIAGIACMIEGKNGSWTVIDLGSQPDLKLNGKTFVEQTIDGDCTLQVGDHHFEIKLVPFPKHIFEKEIKDVATPKTLTVVRWHGQLLETARTEDELEVASGSLHIEGIEVSKFKVPNFKEMEKETFTLDPELKKPMLTTLLTLFIFFAIIFGLPMPKEEVQEKPKDNVYTRMIFDSKILAQKKKQIAGFGPRSAQGTGNGNGSLSEGAKGQASKATKVVNSLRQAGVHSIISKIAARASQNAKMIAALTATPSATAATGPTGIGDLNNMPSSNAANGTAGVTGNGKGFRVGGIGTGGKGGGAGGYKSGSGLGTGAIGNGSVGLDDAESVVEGGLDREVIAAVIREHLGQIRYCYERQLSASPDLYGKIKVKFSIDAGGMVDTQSVGQTTLNNAMVEECILRRIATWKFPKPKGGTKVLVSYPFLFKSVN